MIILLTAFLSTIVCWIGECFRNQFRETIWGVTNPFGRKKRIAAKVTEKLLGEPKLDSYWEVIRLRAKEMGISVKELERIFVSDSLLKK